MLRVTGFGSNIDPDDWRDQRVDRERDAAEFIDSILAKKTLLEISADLDAAKAKSRLPVRA